VSADASVFVRRPAVKSSAVAVALAVVAVAVVADASVQRRVLVVAVAGTVAFAAGVTTWRRGLPVVGGLVAVGGAAVVLLAVALAVTRPALNVHRLELAPGVLGLWVLAAGVAPVRRGRERLLVAAGTGLVFLAVLTSGVVRTSDLPSLLAAGALTVLAWDTAENAVSLGRQLGEAARTDRAELVHGAASALVAGCAVLLALGVHRLGVEGLPFAALAALLLAGVALAVAHYR
jgi:hypothetical protein